MKAVALTRYLPIDDPESLLDVELPEPRATGHDLLVRVEAVSVNPVDTKVRAPKAQVEAKPKVLGYDAAGIVEAAGEAVTLFKPGDPVYYAGDITRSGSNAMRQLVDERIVGRKPKRLDFAQAAAIPLTAITAWEAFFDRMKIDRGGKDAGKTLLIIGGAGGVGSIGIQLAKLAGLRVIATASRPETARGSPASAAARLPAPAAKNAAHSARAGSTRGRSSQTLDGPFLRRPVPGAGRAATMAAAARRAARWAAT